jgi:Coiled-coil domain-containing protein 55 (DUF2040)
LDAQSSTLTGHSKRIPLEGVFGDDSEEEKDDENPNKKHGSTAAVDVRRVNRTLLQSSATAVKDASRAYEDALSADPSIFEYDEVYESLKSSEATTSHHLSKPSQEPVSSMRY